MHAPNQSLIGGDRTRISRRLAGRVADQLLEGLQVIGRDYRYLYVNEAVARHGRSTRVALLGRTMMECYPGIEETEMFRTLHRCMEDRVAATMENEFIFPDGTRGFFDLRFEPVPEGVAILSIDITERKRADRALGRAIRTMTTLSRCNRAVMRALEERELAREICRILVDTARYRAATVELRSEDDAHRLEEVAHLEAQDSHVDSAPVRHRICLDLRRGASSLGTLTLRSDSVQELEADERTLLDEIALDLAYGVETLRARSAHASTEEQLVAAQRQGAVGSLARGVAHDFNNLLSIIMAYTDFAWSQLNDSDPIRGDLDEVRRAGERASELTHQLLRFGRDRGRVAEVSVVIRELERMLRRVLPANIHLEVRAAVELPAIAMDPVQLEQVLINLAVNAQDAMSDGGELAIEAEEVFADGEKTNAAGGVSRSRRVRIRVRDTGPGMTEEIRRRVFEPFFTTKKVGQGTGLGLSMVCWIVRHVGGEIHLSTAPGEGTTFEIELPCAEAVEAARSSLPPVAMMHGDETILVVEHDDPVRKATERMLASAGYRVLGAGDGLRALQIVEGHDGPIDLLVTDVILPEMSGQELAGRVGALRPGVDVLFTSGYDDAAADHRGVVETGHAFLAKPFSIADLTHKVRELLDRS